MRLHFLGSSTDLINYPYFPFIFNQFGDTIAKGEMEFFGQLGGTKQDYLYITLLNELPSVMYLRLRYDSDSCNFPYFLANSNLPEAAAKPGIFPNPVDEKVFLKNEGEKEIRFSITDQFGRMVKTGKASDEIPVNGLPAGMYFLQLDQSLRRAFLKK